VKALRTHAPDAFDVRMRMARPSRATWYGRNEAREDTGGGYEVQLRDWEGALTRARSSARHEWEARSVYVVRSLLSGRVCQRASDEKQENMPPPCRNVAGIHRFVSSLLPDAREELSDVERIQHVSLPRHHQDKPGDQPKCKGFAIVTFSRREDVQHVLHRWPWERRRTTSGDVLEGEAHEAVRFGFRTTTKSHWEMLNEAYLAYRQKLLDDIASSQQAEPLGTEPRDEPPGSPTVGDDAQEPESVPPDAPMLDLSAPFPPGCLVFVRNVHPETNKTTLRKLFARAFAGADVASANDEIGYVDFNKGMDTVRSHLSAHRGAPCAHFGSSLVPPAPGCPWPHRPARPTLHRPPDHPVARPRQRRRGSTRRKSKTDCNAGRDWRARGTVLEKGPRKGAQAGGRKSGVGKQREGEDCARSEWRWDW
jgi:hypothetical protein